MAQDILITPGSGEPQILFRGSGVNNTAIQLNVLSGNSASHPSGSTLVFKGSQGDLLSIADNVSSGTIFSASDISGLSVIEVDASGYARIGQHGHKLSIGSGVPQYSLDVFGTGNFRQGLVIPSQIPAVTGNAFYNIGGTLYFNGAAIAAYDDTYVSGVAAYASGQAIGNEADIVYVSGLANYASGQAVSNETDLTYVSGVANYASGQSIANEIDIVASSGIANYASGQAIANEIDIVAVSGIANYASGLAITNEANVAYASGQAISNQQTIATDIVAVSGIANYASGQAIANKTDIAATSGIANYASGQAVANEVDIVAVSGIANYASGQAISNETDIVATSGIANYASGQAISNQQAIATDIVAVSGIANYASGQSIENQTVSVYASGQVDASNLQKVTNRGAVTTNNITANNLIVSDGGRLGSASKTNAMTIASDGSVTFVSGVVVDGNLTVNGAEFIIDVEKIEVEDNIILLNKNVTGTPSLNAGIEIERGTSPNTIIRWNEASDIWDFTEDGSTYHEIGKHNNIVLVSGIAAYASGQANTNITNLNYVSGVASYASGLAIANEAAIATNTVAVSGVANYASGQAIANEVDIVATSGIANYASGLAISNETDIVATSGIANYASGQAIANQQAIATDIVAVSGIANYASGQSIVNETDIVATSGIANYASGQAIANEVDIVAVSGIANYASGLAIDNETDIVATSGIANYASGQAIANETDVVAVSGIANYSSGVITGGSASGVTFFSNDGFIVQDAHFIYDSGNEILNIKGATPQFILHDSTGYDNKGTFKINGPNAGNPSIDLSIGHEDSGETASLVQFNLIADKSSQIPTSFVAKTSNVANANQKHIAIEVNSASGLVYTGKGNGDGDIGMAISTNGRNNDFKGVFIDKPVNHGNVGIGSFLATAAQLEVHNKSATQPAIIARAFTSQSANIQEWEAVNDVVLAHVAADGSIATSGTLSASGGLLLSNIVPAVTTNKLYNEGGTLKFNGSAVGGGGGDVTTAQLQYVSGIAVYSSGQAIATQAVDLTAGDGLTGGGTLAANRTFAVGAGNLIDVQANQVDVDLSESAVATIAHGDNLIFLDGGATGAASKGSTDDLANLLAGDGLTKSNSVMAVNVDDSTIETNSDAIRVKDDGITLAKMAGLARGSIIAGDSGGNPSALSIGSNTYVLTSDGTDISWAAAGGGVDAYTSGVAAYASGVLNGGSASLAATDATKVALIAKAAAAQSANLQEWQASDGIAVASVAPDGSIASSGNVAVSGQILVPGGGGTTAPTICFTGGSNNRVGFYEKFTDNQVAYCAGGRNRVIMGDDRLQIGGLSLLGFSSSSVGEAQDGSDANFRRNDPGIISVHRTNSNSAANLGQFLASGVSASGVELLAHVPTSTTNRLYNEGGTLKFDGSAVGGVDAYTSGVATYASGNTIATQAVDLTAGDGLTGGGTLAANRTFAVGAGNLIDVQANQVDVDLSEAAAATIAHGDNLIFLDGGATGAASKGSTDDLAGLLAGDGLTKSNSVMAVNVDDSTIETNSDAIRVKDDGITLAKMAGITRGSLIVGDSSGNPSALAAGSNTYVLTSDGTDISWAAAGGGGVDAYTSGVAAYASGVLNGGSASLAATAATKVALITKAAASQSANLQEWQASNDVVLAHVAPDGSIASSGNIGASGNLTISGNTINFSDNSLSFLKTGTNLYISHNATNTYAFSDAMFVPLSSKQEHLGFSNASIHRRWRKVWSQDFDADGHIYASGDIFCGGELQTANIGYTDGDNSMTIADGGKVTFAAGFAVGSDAEGDMLYHNGTSYIRLAKGSDGYILKMNGNVPNWESGGAPPPDNSVDSQHYVDGSIDHVHLAGDCVDGDNIADDSIDSEHYVNGSIDTAHIGDNQVTADKLAHTSVTAGTYTTSTITVDAQGRLTAASSGGGGSPGGVSDKRLKDKIKNIEGSLEKILAMNPVEFDWLEGHEDIHSNSGKDIGFIAQEIEKIQPELTGDLKDFKTLDYGKFAPLIVGAIQDLTKEIREIKKHLKLD